MGQSRRINDEKIWRKRTPSFPFHEERSKAKEVENDQYTSALMRERLKLFAQLFLLISSVSTEQSQICVKGTNPAMLQRVRLVLVGQSDPLFEPTSFFDENTCTFDR